jgi:hypothetical protein
MSAYTDAAPNLSKAITVTKFREDNPQPTVVDSTPPPKPTISKIRLVYNALLTMEERGIGYRGVAKQTGVSLDWVKRIHREMIRAKGAVWA